MALAVPPNQTIKDLVDLHSRLSMLDDMMFMTRLLPEHIDGDKVRSIRDVLELIEAMVAEEKKRQKIIKGTLLS